MYITILHPAHGELYTMLFSMCFTLLVVPFLLGRGPVHDGARESSMGPDVSKHRHQYCPPVIDVSYYTTVVVVVVYRKNRTCVDLPSIPQSGEKMSSPGQETKTL